MDPYTVYRKVIYDFINFHAKCVGHNIFDRLFKPNIVTYICLALWKSVTIIALYTAFTGSREVSLTNLFLALLGAQVFRSE